MAARLLMLVVMFAFLWTGTFLHDQFGSKLLASALDSNHLTLNEQTQAFDIATKDSCPCASHIHSASISCNRLIESTIVLLNICSTCIALVFIFSLRYELEREKIWMLKNNLLNRPQASAYILHRALLI